MLSNILFSVQSHQLIRLLMYDR